MSILTHKTYLRSVNKLLILAIIGVSVYFVFLFMNNGQSFEPTDYAGHETAAPLEARLSLEDTTTYKKVVSGRELFRPFVFSKKKNAQIITINDLAKDLMLVGVVSVDNKEAIIKNRRTRQTYFVTVGTTIGELKVENISDNKVEISYKEERKELFLR